MEQEIGTDAQERFQALHDMPFGTYGQFLDQYGVQWIFKGDRVKSVTSA